MSHDSLDLRAHFGLRAVPFTRELAIEQRWLHPPLDEAAQDILTAIHARMCAALIAPAGTGKTVTLRAIRSQLPEARYRVHYVKVTSLSRRDFTRELCRVVQVETTGHYNTLVERFQERATTLLDHESIRPVLLIDEAHDMRPDVLASVRVLTNFEMDSRLVVSVILAGQGHLRALLQRPELEALTRRLSHVASLRLLSRAETADYVDHRLTIVGAPKGLFAYQTLDAVHEIAGGNLRAIDHLALKAMERAVRAGHKTVTVEHVTAARQALLP